MSIGQWTVVGILYTVILVLILLVFKGGSDGDDNQ